MAKLRQEMGFNGDRNRRTYLTADMFAGEVGGGVVAVLTVDTSEVVDVGNRKELLVTFAEYPENPWWTNRTSAGYLIDGIGDDDTDVWPGVRVPLVKVFTENPTTREKTTKLYPLAPVRPTTWNEAAEAFVAASQAPNTGGARKPKEAKEAKPAAAPGAGNPATTDASGAPLKF